MPEPSTKPVPVEPAATQSVAKQHSLAERTSQLVTRMVVLAAGLGLIGGFFMPWLKLGDAAALSGLGLLISSGTVIDALAGPSKVLLLIIPLSGAAMVAAALAGPKAAARTSLIGGTFIMGLGFYTLVRVFLDSTGIGTWLVAASALLACGAGLTSSSRR